MNHLLIDENLPASLAATLPIPCSHATDLGKQPTDRQIWDYARERNWNIITRDTDFFDRLLLDGPPPKVIWVRLGNDLQKIAHDLILRQKQLGDRLRVS